MSNYMDEVDREFIKCLFPEYLLQQPVAYYLWMTYYQHKKLFNKIKNGGSHRLTNQFTSRNGHHGTLPERLSYATRKEVWQRLMNLGVLGTLSFDSATDEYLVQVYRYFYPPPADMAFNSDKINSREDEGIEDIAPPSTMDAELNLHNSDRMDEMSRADDEVNGNDDVDEENDENDEDDEDEDDAPEDDDNDEDEDIEVSSHEDDEIAVEEDVTSHNTDNSSSHASNSDAVSFYPALATPKFPPKSKKNSIVPDIYQMLGYFLPSQWVTQSNNSILLSADGISHLCPHPNWQAYMALERTSSSTRNRLRNSFSGNQKNDFAVTWANHSLPLNKLGIFYYEIRVLSVTSSQGAQNSNIIVGYKQWFGSNSESSSQGAENEQHSSTSSSVSGIATGLRSSLRGRGSTEGTSSNEETSSSNKLGIEEGFFAYCGSDGSITAGSQYKSYSKSFGRDDVIGCGVNYVNGTIFFTKNGVCLGTAFTDFYDVTLIPYIALRPGNSVRTNFGLYEEFVFDIVGYQDKWKAKAYRHIFKSIDTNEVLDEFDSEDEEKLSQGKDDACMDIDEEGLNSEEVKPMLPHDSRFNDDQLIKPDVDKLNTLNTGDDSIPTTLHTMINDYLIHEGLIDVAKGFLKDLKKDAIQDSNERRGQAVITHNERQIIKEEKNLKIRQDLRRFITGGNVSQCLKYIEIHLPGLLQENIELLFELKLAQYLLIILNYKDYRIEEIVNKGQVLSKEFVYDESIPQSLREKFRSQLSNVSALLAYDDPVNESSEELTAYLSNEYLQDRLFQIVNTSVLTFLQKNSECELENVVKYTRAMLGTLMNFEAEGSVVYNGTELRFYKILNMDEDLLNL